MEICGTDVGCNVGNSPWKAERVNSLPRGPHNRQNPVPAGAGEAEKPASCPRKERVLEIRLQADAQRLPIPAHTRSPKETPPETAGCAEPSGQSGPQTTVGWLAGGVPADAML